MDRPSCFWDPEPKMCPPDTSSRIPTFQPLCLMASSVLARYTARDTVGGDGNTPRGRWVGTIGRTCPLPGTKYDEIDINAHGNSEPWMDGTKAFAPITSKGNPKLQVPTPS